MFEAVRNNRKIVQVFLVLITLPFALWGVDSYIRGVSGEDTVAEVGSLKISDAQLTDAVRTQRENMRSQMGESFNQAATETPEFRLAVLDSLINKTALFKKVSDAHMYVPDALLQQYIQEKFPEFQENGKFSMQQYQAILRSNGKTELSFEQDLRQNLALQMTLTPIAQSAITPKAVLMHWLALQDEERTVAAAQVNAKSFEAQVKLDANAAKDYYDANKAGFETPEQVKVEYVVLSADEIAKQIQVSDADAKKWYDDHPDKYQEPEERRASHILIEVGEKATPAEKAQAKKKAEAILAKVKADPSSFAKIAKEESSDKVSAEKGGDLGFFARGAMVKAFDDAVFKLKPQEISDLVETDYGYHIIRLTDIRGGKVKPFEAAKADIVAELKKSQAEKKYAEAADQFSNIVYEQADSFKPVEDKFGLKSVTTDWIAKGGVAPGVLNNEKLLAAIFGSDAIKNRRNTEAVDVGNGTLVSARVLDHKAAALRPFEEVKAQIERQLTTQKAAELAKADGEAKLAKLKAGEAQSLSWADTKTVKRSTAVDMSAAARKAVFGLKADKLPAYVGVAEPSGYVIYRLDKVNTPKISPDDSRLATLSSSYSQALGEQDLRSFIDVLRSRFGVKKHEDRISKSQG